MGCTPSKRSVCRNCNAQCSPVRRSYSSCPGRSPAHDDDDNHHHDVKPRASTTLGYLFLNTSIEPDQVRKQPNLLEKNNKDFSVGVVEAKTWSKAIDEKLTKVVPKTPIDMPPDEPETINAWELMEGLDDSSPFHPPMDHVSGFVFNTGPHMVPLDQSTIPSLDNDRKVTLKNFDQDSTFDQSIVNVTPRLINEKPQSNEKKVTVTSHARQKKKLVLYYTSLRCVRKTHEDCCLIRVILKNSGFLVDERDVSMHSGFKEELKELLGDQYGGGRLPKVFVGREYIGGADEIKRLHDEFRLDKVLDGCERVVDHSAGGGDGAGGDGCEACGDIRFLPCDTCSGSCKIYYEFGCDEGENEKEESDHGFQRCRDCNENGLIRCPICCD